MGSLSIHTISQFNESINLNDTNMSVFNSDVNGGHCYMNIPTVLEANNHNYVYSINKIDKFDINISEMENTVL